ncbi:hypothetical protein SLS57_011624 [Botryosphaeria dothidea]
MSGYHYASDRLALPAALLTHDPRTQAQQWFLGWDVGRKIGPTLVHVVAGCFAFVAFRQGSAHPGFGLHVLGAVAAGCVGPYTFVKVFPVNDVLLAECRKEGAVDKEKVRGSIEKWRSEDRVRAAMMHVAALAGLVALMKGG